MKANQSNQISNWDRMVYAPFKKVVKFDVICMGLGIVMGTSIGIFLVAGAVQVTLHPYLFYYD